jgi:succinate dehydrogenase / fumarate reductase cytochrome b subunit
MYKKRTGFLKYYFEEWGLNANVGTFSWILHRVTGVILTVYLFAHILVVSSSLGGSQNFNAWLSAVQTPLTHFLEIFLIAVVAFHLLNGLRITITDFFFVTKEHKAIFWVEMAVFAFGMIITLVVFLPRVFSH